MRSSLGRVCWASACIPSSISGSAAVILLIVLRRSALWYIRNNYSAETFLLLSHLTGYSISELLRIHTKQKSEKPGGIYFEKEAELEHYILEQALDLGFEMNNYRWCYKDIPVHVGEFLHNPTAKLRNS